MTVENEKNVEAALAWAERMEKGLDPNKPYDPWFITLAASYRELKQENERLTTVLGLDDGAPDWRDAIDALRTARERITELEALAIRLVQLVSFYPESSLTVGGNTYSLIVEWRSKKLTALVESTRKELGL